MIVIYEPGKDPETLYRLSLIDKSTINHIRLERENSEPIEFSKQDSGWVMLSPYALNTTQINVESLLDLLDYTYQAIYDVKDIELKKYKLKKPRTSIIYNGQYRFGFGTTESLNKFRYLQADNKMYLIVDYFHHRIHASALSYINHALIENDLSIEKITLPNLSLSLSDGNWSVTPATEKFSNDQANELVDNWKHVYAVGIVEYTNEKSSAKVSLAFKNNPTPLSFDVITKDNAFYLARPDIKIMYKLANDKRRDLLQLPAMITEEQLEKEISAQDKSKPGTRANTRQDQNDAMPKPLTAPTIPLAP